MKFAQHLSAHVTPEWHKQYIRYDFFKEFIYKVAADSPPIDESSLEERQVYFREQDEEFFRLCSQELTKVESFFCEKLAEANRKYAELIADLTELQSAGELAIDLGDVDTDTRSPSASSPTSPRVSVVRSPARAKAHSTKKLRELKLAFSEFYLSLVLLQSYQQLNSEGFRKMLKKHDKVWNISSGAEWRDAVVYEKSFRKNHEVDALIQKVETVFTNVLERGDRTRAMKRLRVPPLTARHSAWVTFRVGMLTGVVVVLLVCTVLLGAFAPVGTITKQAHTAAIRIFRGTLLIIVFIGLCGVNTYGWRKAGVNHVLIFEIDPRNHLSALQLLEMALIFATAWLLALIVYLAASAGLIAISPYLAPFTLVITLFVAVFVPIPCFYLASRKWFLRKLARCCVAPFRRVHFADFWLADQLNSLVLAIADLQFAVCFFAVDFDWMITQNNAGNSDFVSPYPANNTSIPSPTVASAQQCNRVTYGVTPFITAFPALIRFLQCWRRYYDGPVKWHVLNAGKYSTTFFVVIFQTLYGQFPDVQAFLLFWVISGFVSAIYGYVWDVTMDWGLFDKRATDNRFLRDEIVYRYRAYYYAAIVEDLIIRFSWLANVLTNVLGVRVDWQKESVKTAIAFSEALRRCIWNFFRLENEHVNNCGQYRAVRDISIAPVSDRDFTALETIMDNENELAKLRAECKAKRRQQIQRMIEHDREETQARTGLPSGQPRRRRSTLFNIFKQKPQQLTHETLAADDALLQEFWAQLQLSEPEPQLADAPAARFA